MRIRILAQLGELAALKGYPLPRMREPCPRHASARLFANPTKSGGTYYVGKTNSPVTIPAGARLKLLKSKKTASNGAEMWSLVIEDGAADDRDRVMETTSNRAGEIISARCPDADEPF